MVIGNLPASQYFPDFLLFTYVSQLINPHRTHTERMGCQKDIFQCAGIVLHCMRIVLFIGRYQKYLGLIHVVMFSFQLLSYHFCKLLYFLFAGHNCKFPGLIVMSAGSVKSCLHNLFQFFLRNFFFLKSPDTSSCQNIFHNFVHSQISFLLCFFCLLLLFYHVPAFFQPAANLFTVCFRHQSNVILSTSSLAVISSVFHIHPSVA